MLLGLVLLGCGSRLLIADLPNFKPLAAIALFSGFYFRSLPMALAATALSLLISDSLIGSYDWPIAASVYGSLLVGCVVGRSFIGRSATGSTSAADDAKHTTDTLETSAKNRDNHAPAALLSKSAIAALAMSCLFFVVTNFAVWATGSWYPTSFEGLVGCYANAVPFFKYTAAGDLAFTCGLFGVYALVSATVASRRSLGVVELR